MQIDDGLLLWPNSWEVVRKMKGRTLIRAHWTLSEDRKTLNDAFVPVRNICPMVRHCSCPMCTSGRQENSGFLGTRDCESAKVTKGIELQILPRM